MSFSVKQLREMFSFPGVDESKEVDLFLGGAVSVGRIGSPGPELGDNIAMAIDLPEGYYLTTSDPEKIVTPRWIAAVGIGDFADRWVLINLPHGCDFGKFVSDGHSSGTWYDATDTALKNWPEWVPLPEGSSPDPRLVAVMPDPPSAPLTVTILSPVSDPETLTSILMFELAKADGFDLKSPSQPEWEQYIKRATSALRALQDVDQLRSLWPTPVSR
jgi:hypothetical protein